jgi:NitT/TauT family transport system substrate-binding protein
MRSRQTRRGFSPRTLQSLRKSPSSKWWDSDAEDTVRFTSLRLREAGMIKSKSQQDLRNGTDWRFWNDHDPRC